MSYTLQISALGEFPLSLSDSSIPEWGHALIRSREGIITGVLFDITGSAVTDYPLEYLSAVRNCIFSPDQEARIYLDNEGQCVFIEISLQKDGSILCTVDLSDLEPTGFIEGAHRHRNEATNIRNEIIDGEYKSYYLTFPSSAVSWCESVIALARSVSDTYELLDEYSYNYYDASGYVRDLEAFRDSMAEGLNIRTIEEIISEIEVSPSAPIIRPGPGNPNAKIT